MKTKTILYIVGGIVALAVISGIAENARKENAPATNTVQAAPIAPAPEPPVTLACSQVGAYSLTKQWVKFVVKDPSIVLPSFEDEMVQHDPAGNLYQVRSYYFKEGRQVEFYSAVRCVNDHWKAELLTVNGQQFAGSDDWQ